MHHYAIGDLEGLLAYELDIIVDHINALLKSQQQKEEGMEYAFGDNTMSPNDP